MANYRFGYSGSPFAEIDTLIDLAQRAERAGFDTFLLADLPRALSPLQALTAIARATESIRVSPFVLNTGVWDPSTIVRELATLDRLSGGRLEIALGSGIPQPALAAILPPTRAARFERLQQTVEAIRTAAGEPGISPGFVGSPRLLIAGTSARVLRLAGERADGLIIAQVPPTPKVSLPPGQMILPELEATRRHLEVLRAAARERPDPVEIGTGAPVTLTDDAEREATALAEIHTYLSPQQILDSPKILIGTVAEVAARIRARGELGLTYQVLRGPSPEELAPVLADVKGG
jgi:probable F420-dependent oxidoreductase